MWNDLKQLFRCKRECFMQSQQQKIQAAATEQAILAHEDRLVLL